jgi:biotin carboxylase
MSNRAAASDVKATVAARVLIIAPHGSYRTFAYLAAAERLGVQALIVSEGKHSIISAYAQGLHVDFADRQSAMRQILAEARRAPIVGVIGTDDSTTELASLIAQQLQLPHNHPSAVQIASRKDLARAALALYQVPKPQHRLIDLTQPLPAQLRDLVYPVVVKPVSLSASRGVIRADDPNQLAAAIARIANLLAGMTDLEPLTQQRLLVEEFIEGQEVAVEGMLTRGKLSLLAIFDKPEPLNGPYFEETYYITPSRWSDSAQQQIHDIVAQACHAYGLREGPIHAECRINDRGVFVLEVAARTIGGMCAKLLRFGTGYSLEELVLTQAMGTPLPRQAASDAAGVLMIPIPKAGMLKRVEGLLAAQRVLFIEEIDIQVREGHELIPLPEGSSYLGFIFARAPTPAQAEQALREAHGLLHFVVAPIWKLAKAVNA